MSDPRRDSPAGGSTGLESRRARREARRQSIRRRRRLAGASTLLVALLAVLAVVLAETSGPGPRGARPARGQRPVADPAKGAGSSGARATGAPGRTPVPILMYHVIAPPPAGAPFPGLYVDPSEFSEQMSALHSAGWHAVTLDQVEAYWLRGVPLGPGKPIVLTFDNGYQSQYTVALPVLRHLGWVADENMQLSGLPPSQGGLGQQEIRALVAAGWELDTQGFTHADLVRLSGEQLQHEVAASRAEMQSRYHVPVNWFCYPSGHYDATVVAAVRAAGYRGSTTVVPGWAHREDDLYRLHRLRVLGGTSGPALLAEIAAVRGDAPAPDAYTGG